MQSRILIDRCHTAYVNPYKMFTFSRLASRHVLIDAHSVALLSQNLNIHSELLC